MDIPSLDKTIFLIDRKDLDTQTSSAFQAYENNDVIAVEDVYKRQGKIRLYDAGDTMESKLRIFRYSAGQ